RLTPLFSTNRVVRQYTEEHYLSAASAFKDRAKNRGAAGADLLAWHAELAKYWPAARFGTATVEQKQGELQFQVQVFLNGLAPEAVAAELYADAKDGVASSRHSMARGQALRGSNGFLYTAKIPASRPPADYTPRLVPARPGALVPLEAAYILCHESP